MAVRVDDQGFVHDSGHGPLPPWYNKPGQLRQEYLISAAMRVATIPRAQIAAIRPQVPQVLLPPREGYDDTPPTIGDILNLARWTPTRRSWVSGASVELQRSYLTEDRFQGAQRNSFAATDPLG